MLNKEIYKGALKLLGEVANEEMTADYADRAPYILANFICENAALNAKYCEFCGETERRAHSAVYAALDGEFPLSSRFAPSAEYYLAAMLIDGEDGDRSDTFFDRHCKALAEILAEIPATRQRILNAYGA